MPTVDHKNFQCVKVFTLMVFKDNCWLKLLTAVQGRSSDSQRYVKDSVQDSVRRWLTPSSSGSCHFQQCTDFSWQYGNNVQTFLDSIGLLLRRDQWKEILPCAIFLSSVRGMSMPPRTNSYRWLPGSNRCRSLPQRSVLGSPRYPTRTRNEE